MGLEAPCKLRLDRYTFAGRAHLDADQLIFRGETRVAIPLREIISAEVTTDGELLLTRQDGPAILDFEARHIAATWLRRLSQPRSRADKLGLKNGQRIACLDLDEPELLAEIVTRTSLPPASTLSPGLDLIFYAADSIAALSRLKELRRHLLPTGAIWVVSRKGRGATLQDVEIMRAARDHGLVDNKVCSFSATHTALRLVIPKTRR